MHTDNGVGGGESKGNGDGGDANPGANGGDESPGGVRGDSGNGEGGGEGGGGGGEGEARGQMMSPAGSGLHLVPSINAHALRIDGFVSRRK